MNLTILTEFQLLEILTIFNLNDSDVDRVLNVLALMELHTSVTVSEFVNEIEFLEFPIIRLPISLEETVGVVGFMGNAGLLLDMKGTALRAVLKRICDTEFNYLFMKLNISIYSDIEDGKKDIRSIIDILQDIQDAQVTSQQLCKIFGIPAYICVKSIIDQGVETLRGFVTQLKLKKICF